MKKFGTPSEEALSIAQETRAKMLKGKYDLISILLSCSIIATNTGKNEDLQWITCELDGYYKDPIIVPHYRQLIAESFRTGDSQHKTTTLPYLMRSNIYKIQEILNCHDAPTVQIGSDYFYLREYQFKELMQKLSRRCFNFLNQIMKELQYGSAIEYLMEELRQETDKKLLKLDERIAEEAASLRCNLTSNNPADWNKVGHSCRTILVLIADKLYPAKDEPASKTNGKHPLTKANYLNRLMAYMDEKLDSKDDRALIKTEIELLKNNLECVNERVNKMEHDTKAQKIRTELIAIRTYIIISEILKLT